MNVTSLSAEMTRAALAVRQPHLDRLRKLGIDLSALRELAAFQQTIGFERVETHSDGTYNPSSDGWPACLVAVIDPFGEWGDTAVYDIVAFASADPARWWWRVGNAFALGEHLLELPRSGAGGGDTVRLVERGRQRPVHTRLVRHLASLERAARRTFPDIHRRRAVAADAQRDRQRGFDADDGDGGMKSYADFEKDNVVDLKGFRAFDLAEFITYPFPPRERMLAPWLPSKGLAMVFAPRGVGKTFFALNVGYAVASGGSFLKWRADKPRKVLLLDGEMTGVQLQERLSTIIDKSAHEPAEGYFRLIPFDTFIDGITPDLSTSEGQAIIDPHLSDAELIIVDNLSTLCRSGKENEAESWGQIQSWALTQRKKGRSVLFVHHAGKAGEQRGTSRREDVLDTVIRLSNPEDYEPSDGARFVVTFTKSRGFHGSDADPFEATLNDGDWACVESKDILDAQVRALMAQGMTVRDMASELNVSKSKISRVQQRIKADA
jgi:hypothetical protein